MKDKNDLDNRYPEHTNRQLVELGPKDLSLKALSLVFDVLDRSSDFTCTEEELTLHMGDGPPWHITVEDGRWKVRWNYNEAEDEELHDPDEGDHIRYYDRVAELHIASWEF